MKKIAITIIGILLLYFNLKAQEMNILDKKQREIVRISAATATGDLENLKISLNSGLDAGLSINEIKEILVQMYAYTGFPRSLNAINTFIAVLEERKAKGISDETGAEPTGFSDKAKYAKGKQTLETLSGRKEMELAGANAFAPAIDEFLKEHLFADIFGRGVLAYEQRELATISALSALGNVVPQLNGHKALGKNVGLTDNQIAELSKIVQDGQKSVYPRGNRLPNDWFSGVAWLSPLVSTTDTEGFYSIGQVTFAAGSRTFWHTHPAGQILLCTDGKGWYRERGKPARALTKGDVVIIPKDVEHWHGAAADSPFVHIAVTNYRNGSGVTWLQAVTEEEYNTVNTTVYQGSQAQFLPKETKTVNGVKIEKVSFRNRFNNNVAGNLYFPPNHKTGRKYAAIVVGHPFGGVKEQTSGLHAQKMAELGYITLAFDATHYGESGGEPRYIESPEARVEDFSAAVDFLGNHKNVDANAIGVIGICGGGGYSVSAAQIDHRIKAVATVSMYDMGRARRQGLGDIITYGQRMKTLDEIGEQRTREFSGEPRKDIAAIPEALSENDTENTREFFDYYRTPRGQHPNSTTGYSFTSLAPMMNFFPFVQIETISPRPLLFIVGERAVSAYFSKDAYGKAAEPKELFVVPGASHVDLYDRPEYMEISLAKLDDFFKKYLCNFSDFKIKL